MSLVKLTVARMLGARRLMRAGTGSSLGYRVVRVQAELVVRQLPAAVEL